jgi:hypothetical protein
MSEAPWPPEVLPLAACGGDWTTYCDRLYGEFYRDFVAHRPSFLGKRVGVDRNRVVKGREEAFWHCISEGEVEEERLPDPRRCERIGWARLVIEAAGSDRVHWWRNRRGCAPRAVVALADFSYVVILQERRSHWLLITAYPTEHEHSRRKLRAEFEAATEKG